MAAEQPRVAYQAVDFPGQMSDLEPQDLPPGAAVAQVNVQSDRPGRLAVRGGLRLVTYDDEG